MPPGKFTDEKIQVILRVWASWVDSNPVHENSFAKEAGLVLEDLKKDEPDMMVDLGALAHGECQSVGRAASSEDLNFNRGDEVVVMKRMTWSVSRPGLEDVRRDVRAGTPATVLGFADAESRKILFKGIKVLMTLEGADIPREVVHQAPPGHLMHASKYHAQAGSSSEQPP